MKVPLTRSGTTILQQGVTHYENTQDVRTRLRLMSDEELEAAFVQGIRELGGQGPADGDLARSEFLMTLVKAEMDRRFDAGPEDYPAHNDG